MKRPISYDDLKAFAKSVAVYLKDKYPDDTYHLVAVSRGGLTLAHLVAYQVARPVNFFIPAEGRLVLTSIHGVPVDQIPPGDSLVFLEDLIAKGRTYSAISTYMAVHQRKVRWELIPVVIDAYIETPTRVSKYMMKTADWMVFPYEDDDHVKEGDHGLFREGTSQNAKAIV